MKKILLISAILFIGCVQKQPHNVVELSKNPKVIGWKTKKIFSASNINNNIKKANYMNKIPF